MRYQLHSSSVGSTSALQRLFELQEYSLARYAAQAELYGRDEAYPYLAAIIDIADDQSLRASAIGSLLTHRRVPVEHRGFPFSFTGLNYVSAEYVARLLLASQPELIAEIRTCMAPLEHDPEARGLANDVLAGETANWKTLRRVVGSSASVSEANELRLAA